MHHIKAMAAAINFFILLLCIFCVDCQYKSCYNIDMSKLFIDLCNPFDHGDEFTLAFELNDNTITKRWSDLVLLAQALRYPIDDPHRFYGFDLPEVERDKALALINNCIDQINSHQQIIDRKLEHVDDQDTLNYLHHVFEEYHGLLDQQDTDFWMGCPPYVKQALANLNVYVHRCESAIDSQPRMVVTYYGLPKACRLEESDYQLFTPYAEFGDLYLNYVEIGKTLSDLWHDQDRYIHDDAFQPFQRFSADFAIKFHDIDRSYRDRWIAAVWRYFDEHKDFFESRGYQRGDPRLAPFSVLPLGKLIYDDKELVLREVQKRQQVKAVRIQ